MAQNYLPTYLVDMAKHGKNFFEYLTHKRFTKFLGRLEPRGDGSQGALSGPIPDVIAEEISPRGSDAPSISVSPNLIDLFKQSEVALQQLRSTRRAYKHADSETKETVAVTLKLHQSVYDELQEKFRMNFLQLLASENLLEINDSTRASTPASISSGRSKTSIHASIREDPTPVVDSVEEHNADQDTGGAHEHQLDSFEQWMADNEPYRQAIKDSKAHLMKIKDEGEWMAKTETYYEKVHGYELAVENGECSLSRDDFDINYAQKCDDLLRDKLEAEEEFWTAIHNALERGMIVDTYVEDMQEEGQPDDFDDGSAVDPAAPQPHSETLTAFERRMGRWLSPLADPEELADVNQLDPIYPEDNLIDRDVVDSNAGLLFARPDTVEAPPDIVLARASEKR